MQNSIIDQLTPKQRALLYTAMLSLKDGCNEALANSIIHTENNMQQQFFSDTKKNFEELTQILFGECFVEDLDYMHQYTKELKLSALNPASDYSKG
jgi:hypothetical protein